MNVSSKIHRKEIPPTEDRDEILEFIKNSPRGIVKGYSGKRIEWGELQNLKRFIYNFKFIKKKTKSNFRKNKK